MIPFIKVTTLTSNFKFHLWPSNSKFKILELRTSNSLTIYNDSIHKELERNSSNLVYHFSSKKREQNDF